MNARLGAFAGFAFLALSFATFALAPSPPAPDAASSELVAWYAGDPDGIRAIAVVFALAIVAFVGWLAALRDRIWIEGRPTGLAAAATAGAAILAVCWMAAAGVSSAVAMRIDELGEDVVVFAGVLAGVLGSIGQLGLVVMAAAVSKAGSGVLSRTTVAIGWAASGFALVSSLGVGVDSESLLVVVSLSWLATSAWVVAGSVELLRAARGNVRTGVPSVPAEVAAS